MNDLDAPKKTDKPTNKRNPDSRGLFIALLSWALFVVISLFLLTKLNQAILGSSLNIGWTLIALATTYLILSLKILNPQEIGAVGLLGRLIADVNSGLVFVPWLLCQLYRLPKPVIQMQIPEEPENVDKSGDDNKTLAEGMVRPIRAPLAGGTAEEIKKDPLKARITTEPSAVVRFRIVAPCQFLSQIHTVEAAKKQIRDTIEAAIKEIFGKKTAADVIAQWAEINGMIKERVEQLVEENKATGPAWGVEVYTVQLVDNDLGKTVNSAIRDIAAKAYAAQAVVITSEGKRQETINLAQGEGQRITLTQTALAEMKKLTTEMEAAGYKKLAEELKITEGDVVLITVVLREMFEKSQYSIIGGGNATAEIMGFLPLIRKALADLKGPQTVSTQG